MKITLLILLLSTNIYMLECRRRNTIPQQVYVLAKSAEVLVNKNQIVCSHLPEVIQAILVQKKVSNCKSHSKQHLTPKHDDSKGKQLLNKIRLNVHKAKQTYWATWNKLKDFIRHKKPQ